MCVRVDRRVSGGVRGVSKLAFDKTLKPANQTLAQFVDEKAAKFEHRDALVSPSQDVRMTFAEWKVRVRASAFSANTLKLL